MTKKQLVDKLARQTGLTKKQSELILNTLTDTIITEVKKGQKVALTGFGTFERGLRASRTGINPQTGKKIKIGSMPLPKFRAGTRFKKALRTK